VLDAGDLHGEAGAVPDPQLVRVERVVHRPRRRRLCRPATRGEPM
jgi:hypothetical protein